MEQWALPISIVTAMPYRMAESVIEDLAGRGLVPAWVPQAVPIVSCREGYPPLTAFAPEGRGLLIDVLPPSGDLHDLPGWIPVPELTVTMDTEHRYFGVPTDHIEERAFPTLSRETEQQGIRANVVRRAAAARLGRESALFWPTLRHDQLGDQTPLVYGASSDAALAEVLTVLAKERLYI
jgi:hypothetical protein